MERKLERCIRLSYLCVLMCVRVLKMRVFVCERCVCFSGATIKHQSTVKNNRSWLVYTSLGAFARWKAPSIPRWTTTKNATTAFVAAMSFHWRAFCFCFFCTRLWPYMWVCMFCWPCGELNFRWDFKLVFVFAGGKFSEPDEGKPVCFCIGAHTHVMNCHCVHVSSRMFPLQFLLQPNVYVEFPLFVEIVLTSPDFPYIFVFGFWALLLIVLISSFFCFSK